MILQKYNLFMAQIGCAAIGVLAFSIFGAGWLARSTALAASIAFMIYTGATHPPGNAQKPWQLTLVLSLLLASSLRNPQFGAKMQVVQSKCSCKFASSVHWWSQVAPLKLLVCFVSWRYWMHSPLFDCKFFYFPLASTFNRQRSLHKETKAHGRMT